MFLFRAKLEWYPAVFLCPHRRRFQWKHRWPANMLCEWPTLWKITLVVDGLAIPRHRSIGSPISTIYYMWNMDIEKAPKLWISPHLSYGLTLCLDSQRSKYANPFRRYQSFAERSPNWETSFPAYRLLLHYRWGCYLDATTRTRLRTRSSVCYTSCRSYSHQLIDHVDFAPGVALQWQMSRFQDSTSAYAIICVRGGGSEPSATSRYHLWPSDTDNPLVSNRLSKASTLCSMARQSLSIRLLVIPSRATSCELLNLCGRLPLTQAVYQFLPFVRLSLEFTDVPLPH